jgi:molybdate transport system regulatory protein
MPDAMNPESPVPTIRFRIDLGKNRALGPGKIALLEHIGACGSLSQAARELGMSYRRAWELLENLNGSFRERVVATSTGGRGGGGAALTPFGRALVRSYRRFETAIQARASRHFSALARSSRNAPTDSTPPGAPVLRLSVRAGTARARTAVPGARVAPVAKPRK